LRLNFRYTESWNNNGSLTLLKTSDSQTQGRPCIAIETDRRVGRSCGAVCEDKRCPPSSGRATPAVSDVRESDGVRRRGTRSINSTVRSAGSIGTKGDERTLIAFEAGISEQSQRADSIEKNLVSV
jgi:hypothetical protein